MPETRNQSYSLIQLELTNENWFTNRHFSSTDFPSPIVGSHHSPQRVLRDIFVDPANHGFRRSGWFFRVAEKG